MDEDWTSRNRYYISKLYFHVAKYSYSSKLHNVSAVIELIKREEDEWSSQV